MRCPLKLNFEEFISLSKKVHDMEIGLAFKRPVGTMCCLDCMVPQEERNFDGECGLCFEKGLCGCRFCKYYVREWNENHVKGHCVLARKLRKLRAFGLKLEMAECIPEGVWYEFQFLRRFPTRTFRNIISVLKFHGFQFSDETCGWGRRFKDDKEAFRLLKPVYEALKEVLREDKAMESSTNRESPHGSVEV